MNNESPTYLHVKVTINGSELYTCGFDDAEVLIGRGADCQVVLENAGISRNHAKIMRENGQLKVLDLHSGNGTFVNGKQVKQAVLNAGDTLRIGKFTLYAKLSNQPPESSQPSSGAGAAETSSGTVFLRPDERIKILRQSKAVRPRERITSPTTKKGAFDRSTATVFFALGASFAFLCSWIFGS